MPSLLDKFVHNENLRRFAEQIRIETDPARLARLKTLLTQEQEQTGPAAVRS